MAEALSPNTKQRAPAFFVGSNDDKLERAQARAAAIRRKMAVPSRGPDEPEPCLGKEQIFELFQNCIKLASENKINQKNTWELKLIDHLYEIVKVEEESDAETNFQKASCTLEAGVKIYSMRVDSVHSEAYKVLGGINRVGQADEQDHVVGNANISNEQEESRTQKDQHRKSSPSTTLESSFAALNVKKFDVAFAVDPLYHQTSAKFDEGGAKGLLLNNLGVYADCRVLFDSLEIPGKCMSSVAQHDEMVTIDLSFAKEYIEPMVFGMLNKVDISPSLSIIVNQFDKDNLRPSELHSSGQEASGQFNENPDKNLDLDGEEFGNCGTWDFDHFDHDDQASTVDDETYDQDPNLSSQQQADENLSSHDTFEDDRSEGVEGFLFLSLGLSTKQNAWAGPSHWKYRKVKESENAAEENESQKAKKTKNKKADSDIDFSGAVDMDISHIFAPPKNPKSLLLPENRVPCNTKLPEDCHYQPENLVKLFLLPHVMCLGRSKRKRTDEGSQRADGFGTTSSWDEEDGSDGAFDDGHAYSDSEESSTLVSQPRQVSKIEVRYDKTSKQVNVHALKETLWDRIQKFNQIPVQEEEAPEGTISFKQVLAGFQDGCRASSSPNDISPHLCFICLLHLANEQGLSITGCPNLDDLSIHRKPQSHA